MGCVSQTWAAGAVHGHVDMWLCHHAHTRPGTLLLLCANREATAHHCLSLCWQCLGTAASLAIRTETRSSARRGKQLTACGCRTGGRCHPRKPTRRGVPHLGQLPPPAAAQPLPQLSRGTRIVLVRSLSSLSRRVSQTRSAGHTPCLPKARDSCQDVTSHLDIGVPRYRIPPFNLKSEAWVWPAQQRALSLQARPQEAFRRPQPSAAAWFKVSHAAPELQVRAAGPVSWMHESQDSMASCRGSAWTTCNLGQLPYSCLHGSPS